MRARFSLATRTRSCALVVSAPLRDHLGVRVGISKRTSTSPRRTLSPSAFVISRMRAGFGRHDDHFGPSRWIDIARGVDDGADAAELRGRRRYGYDRFSFHFFGGGVSAAERPEDANHKCQAAQSKWRRHGMGAPITRSRSLSAS